MNIENIKKHEVVPGVVIHHTNNHHPETRQCLTLKTVLLDDKCAPYKAHEDDAGWDLKARLKESLVIPPGGRATVPAGIRMLIPRGYVGDIRPRSGLVKHLGLMAAYGTVDSGYTGEICVTIINLSGSHQRIEPYERIAQMVILPVPFTFVARVDELEETDRGEKGFGSTGI